MHHWSWYNVARITSQNSKKNHGYQNQAYNQRCPKSFIMDKIMRGNGNIVFPSMHPFIPMSVYRIHFFASLKFSYLYDEDVKAVQKNQQLPHKENMCF